MARWISEAALKALADDFDAHGVAVIEKVRIDMCQFI
jgi:hypothetical protein